MSGKTTEKILCITQARRGSTRLPEKILLPVLGQPLLKFHLDRLQRAKMIDQVVVATTDRAEDQLIVGHCREWGVNCIRGSSEDVLSRFAVAVDAIDPDIVLRVTSDCPLIDPTVLDQLCLKFLEQQHDYISLDTKAYPHGLDCEILSRAAFDAAAHEADNPFEREHVTPFICHRPKRFRIGRLSMTEKFPNHRWTVDYREDFELVKAVLENLYPSEPNFGWRSVVEFLQQNPDIMALNADVETRWREKLRLARQDAGLS